jgi:hypothetical protein
MRLLVSAVIVVSASLIGSTGSAAGPEDWYYRNRQRNTRGYEAATRRRSTSRQRVCY